MAEAHPPLLAEAVRPNRDPGDDVGIDLVLAKPAPNARQLVLEHALPEVVWPDLLLLQLLLHGPPRCRVAFVVPVLALVTLPAAAPPFGIVKWKQKSARAGSVCDIYHNMMNLVYII